MQTMKDVALHVIETLPKEATMDDIMHALYIKTKFDHGEKEIQEGKGISHEEAREKMKKWSK